MSNARELAELGGAYATGGYPHFKNRIINGAMQVWQRGTSQSVSGYGSVDRWILNSNNSTLARSTDVPSGFKYSALLTGTSALNAQITQRIESANCFDLGGKSVTISFWVKSTAGTSNFIVYVNYADVSDNFNTTTFIGQTTVTSPTSTWTQYSFTLNNLPSGVANGLQIGMYRAGTDTSTTYITGVQLEKGSTATAYDYRPYGTELALCQRYCINYNSANANGVYYRYCYGDCVSTVVFNGHIQLPVAMRITPSVTTTGTASNYAIYSRATVTALSAAPAIGSDGCSFQTIQMNLSVASGLTQGSAGSLISNNNQTSYLLFSAEL